LIKAVAALGAEGEARRHLVIDDGGVEHALGAQIAAIAAGDLAEIVFLHLGIVGDDRDRPAHHIAPEQRALRPAQHLDALDIVEVGVQVVVEDVVDVIHEIGDRRVERRRAESGDIAADRHDGERFVGGVDGDAGDLLDQRCRAEHLLGAQLLAPEGGHGEGHFAHGRFAALCRHDYIFRRRDLGLSGWRRCLLGQSHAGRKTRREHKNGGKMPEFWTHPVVSPLLSGGFSAASKRTEAAKRECPQEDRPDF
jgi:hypothetical protein